VRAPVPIVIPGPLGPLEGLVQEPEGEPIAAGVVCHADPLQGGMMHFKVVFRAARALLRAHITALRFNFRGVGASAGVHDHGRGEVEDARAALDEAARRLPGRPLLVGGFSFGAVTALRLAASDPRVVAVFLLGLPEHLMPEVSLLDSLRPPCLVVQGEADEYGSAASLAATLTERSGPISLVSVPKADHFFTGRLGPLEDTLAGWLAGRPWEERR
jgi:alpha/beta superfamily hydrolase